MIWIVFCLSWCQFWHDHQPRDAARIRAALHNWRAGGEASDDFCRCRLPFPIHRLNSRKLLGTICVFRKKFIRIGFILKLRHDLGSSVLRPEDCVISFVEVEHLPDLLQDILIHCCTNFQRFLGELADVHSTFLHDFVSIGALLRRFISHLVDNPSELNLRHI